MEEPRNVESNNETDDRANSSFAPLLAEQEIGSHETLERIWAERAVRLAQAPEEEETGEQITLLLVRLGREVYGLDAQYVNRIEPVEHLTRVPRVPEWVAGVTNLRGRVLSVVNLARLFGLPTGISYEDNEDGAENHQGSTAAYLAVVEAADMALALMVDNVLAVERIPLSKVQEAADTVRGLRSEYVLGVAERRDSASTLKNGNESMVVVLNLLNLLADQRLIIHEEVV
jgi:purine-binding chemotaxis protein CheW